MDDQMPEMNGLEATRQIRASSSATIHRLVPIVAMTAHALDSDRTKRLEAGMNDFHSKPTRVETLKEILHRWLPKLDSSNTVSAREQVHLPHPPDSAPLVFDRKGLLERVVDDEEMVREITNDFLRDVPSQIDELKRQIGLNDAKAVAGKAHEIKGVAATVGVAALSSLAAEFGTASKAGDLDAIANRADEWDRQLQDLKTALSLAGVA